jgi:Kef-type K+ transport system membrane component KefB
VIAMLITLWFMPRWTSAIINKFGATRVSEPEVKFILFILFFLGGLATTAKSEAVLPAYLVGLVVAGVFVRDKTLVHRMRSIAFAVFTPFYFIKAGLYVSLPALWPAFAVIISLLLLKMITKTVGVWPLARTHFMNRREASYTTLLMATGLTFGTISALFRISEPHHRSTAVHDPCHSCHPKRIRADADRPEIFPTDEGRDARLGSSIYLRSGHPFRGRCRRGENS